MISRFSSIFFAIGLCFLALAPAQGQSTYEEKRKEILKKQTNTRAEINVLDARIKSYQKRVDETEVQYNKSFKQYENLNSLISLQDDKISSLETEQIQIEAEITLTQDEIEILRTLPDGEDVPASIVEKAMAKIHGRE